MGMLTPWSHVPHMLLPYGDDMSYSERVHNLVLSVFDWGYRTWVVLPKQNAIAQRYFGHLASKLNAFIIICKLYFNVIEMPQSQESHCQLSKNCIIAFQ